MKSSPPDAEIPSLRLAILLLSLAAFGSGLSMRILDPLLPRLTSDFEISLGAASHTITFFSIAYGASQLLFGPLGDRFGKYLVIGWASVASAMTAILSALAPDFPLLLAARLLAGMTCAALIPLSMAWIGDVVPYQQRQPVLARFLIGQIAGLSAGALIGGLAADYFSWRLPFAGIALLFAALACALFAVNRRLPQQARLIRRSEGSMLQRMLSEFGQVLTRPWARVMLMLVFSEGLFLYGAFAFIATHLHQAHALALSSAGSLVMLFGLGGFLFASNSAQLVRRLGERGLAGVGGLLVMVSLLVIAFAPSWWWAVPGCLFAGVGFYMLHNTLQINATQMAPERRGAAVSAFASCFFLGQSVGVAIAGMLAEPAGTSAVLAAGAFGVMAVAFQFRRLRPRAPAVS